MLIGNNSSKKVLLVLFKEFSKHHTITSLAERTGLSRVGIWKILKALEEKEFIKLDSIGSGKTSTELVKLNWDNELVEKTLAVYLTEEAAEFSRWKNNFMKLRNLTEFLILYGSTIKTPKTAEDIDLLGITKKNSNFVKIQEDLDRIQKAQSKKIHSINFTSEEFEKELMKPNPAFISAVKTGIVLFGQENFIKFINKLSKK